MRIPRIFTTETAVLVGKNIELDRVAANHVARVLRLKPGAKIELFNGDGFSYYAEILHIERQQVRLTITEQFSRNSESPLYIHLFQGVSRGDKMDLTLQKGVELGVKEFTPLTTERCGVKLDEKRWAKKMEHWQKVIISACEQSGRNSIPKLNPVVPFANSLAQDGLALFLDPEASEALQDIPKPSNQVVNLWIGPEGGFSEQEMLLTNNEQCHCVQLGPRILRTETAALATVSAINLLWGDF